MSNSIAVIDIQPLYGVDQTAKQALGEQVKIACETIGFFCVTGHPVSMSLIQETFQTAKAFFDLPEAEKVKSAVPIGATHNHGYKQMSVESLANSLYGGSIPDWREYFYLGKDDIPSDDPYYHTEIAKYFFAPNSWPDYPTQFRSQVNRYFQAMESLATDLMRIFALALNLPETYFDHKVDKHGSHLNLINYPAQTTVPLPGQLRASSHTDFGTLTIVCQDHARGGLQILNKSGQWIDVEYRPGAFVINIGDLMAQWTNDRWTSTLHRVVNPPSELAAHSRRQSLVYFHQPNYDLLIECLPGCATVEDPCRYPPVISGENYRDKITKLKQKVAISGDS